MMAGIVVLGGLAQLIFVPSMASERGKDSGLWFLITIVWLLIFWGFAAIGMVFIGFGLIAGIAGASQGDPQSGMVLGLCLISGLVMVMIEYLPMFALMMTRPEGGSYNRGGRRGRGVRGRRPPSGRRSAQRRGRRR